MAQRPRRRRVVVTGLGCTTPLGADAPSTWDAAVAGRSGIRTLTRFDAVDFPVRIAGEATEALDLGDIPAKEARRLDRMVKLGLAAAREAMRDSGLRSTPEGRERIGVSIGTGIGGLETLHGAYQALFAEGPRRVSPFAIPMSIGNMASGYVAVRLDLRGPNLCLVGACASGGHAIGEAARAIERGDADAMLVGGSEAAITPLAMAGFAAMRALSIRNDAPQEASRPFDAQRDGFVVGEGAAVLVLEERECARARGARPRAVLLGYGRTADAGHIAMPTSEGEGARHCMRVALEDAGLSPAEVDYLNAHATSTPSGDIAEARAIRAVFGRASDRLAVSSTKSMTGHLLGAAGALEALLCVRALETGILPPTTNLEHPDPECALDHVANKARVARPRVALSNSFGFGGTNATLVLGRAEE